MTHPHPTLTWSHLGVTVQTCDTCGWIQILSVVPEGTTANEEAETGGSER